MWLIFGIVHIPAIQSDGIQSLELLLILSGLNETFSNSRLCFCASAGSGFGWCFCTLVQDFLFFIFWSLLTAGVKYFPFLPQENRQYHKRSLVTLLSFPGKDVRLILTFPLTCVKLFHQWSVTLSSLCLNT